MQEYQGIHSAVYDMYFLKAQINVHMTFKVSKLGILKKIGLLIRLKIKFSWGNIKLGTNRGIGGVIVFGLTFTSIEGSNKGMRSNIINLHYTSLSIFSIENQIVF